jgi:hypothetical protein
MNEISIPYHLALPSTISIILLIIIIFSRKTVIADHKKELWISISVFLFIYAVIVGFSAYIDISYQIELNNLDKNKDGFFAASEITPKYERYMFLLTNDIGRNVSIITGAIFSFVLALATYFVLKLFKVLRENINS